MATRRPKGRPDRSPPRGSLLGSQVLLRPPTPEDSRLLYDWLNQPEKVSPWDRFEVESFSTTEAAIHHASEDAASLAPRFLVVLRKDQSPIGMVGYYHSYPALDTTDIWYSIMVTSERGKGRGREAVGLLVDYLFSHTRTERVGATSDEENAASVGLLRSLRFQEEGHLRQALFHHGRWHNVVIYGKTRREWEGEADH